MRTLQNQKGFTLIELIVVIVIIGVLSTVAIPKYISLTKDADYAAVQGMVGALNATAALQFGKNRLVAETTYGTATVVTTAAVLGGLLDPIFTTANAYPKWTISGSNFVYTASNTWTCAFTAEVTTAGSEARARVALPDYE